MTTNMSHVLAEAHRLHTHIRNLREQIDRGPRILKAHETKLARQEQALIDSRAELTRLRLRTQEQELSLKATEDQIRKWDEQLRQSMDAREYSALLTELGAGRDRVSKLEESILADLAEIDTRTAADPEAEFALEQAREQFAEYQVEAEQRMERLRRDLTIAEQELTELEANFPIEQKDNYDRLIRAHGADAFSQAKEGTCGHCHSGLTTEKRIRLQGGALICCSACGRLLYT